MMLCNGLNNHSFFSFLFFQCCTDTPNDSNDQIFYCLSLTLGSNSRCVNDITNGEGGGGCRLEVGMKSHKSEVAIT